MTNKVVHNHLENFEIFVLEKLVEYEKNFRDIRSTLADHDRNFKDIRNILADHSVKLVKLEEKLDVLDDRTAFLPKLYDAVDAFMKEIKESREDRVLLGTRVGECEDRLAVVEEICAIKPAGRAF